MEIKRTSFTIVNNTAKDMAVVHEPEGFEFILQSEDEVMIEVFSVENSIIQIFSMDEKGCSVRLLDEKSNYKVFHRGIDVFEKYL